MHALFLDLPCPWEAVPYAHKALMDGGNFCSFSPCIEQVQKTCIELTKYNFTNIVTKECLQRIMDVHPVDVDMLEIVSVPQRTKKRNRSTFEGEDDNELNETSKSERNQNPTQKSENEDPQKMVNRIQTKTLSPILSKPFADIRGHTGFLTFAQKLPS